MRRCNFVGCPALCRVRRKDAVLIDFDLELRPELLVEFSRDNRGLSLASESGCHGT